MLGQLGLDLIEAEKEVGKAIDSPEVRERLRAMGSEPPAVRSPAQFTAFVQRELKIYSELVKRSGATVN